MPAADAAPNIASDAVYLRGLAIDGLGNAAAGIRVQTVGSLTIVNCVIRHFFRGGIIIDGRTDIFSITDTIVSNNSGYGMHIVPSGLASSSGTMTRVSALNNGFASIVVDGQQLGSSFVLFVSVTDSVSSNSHSGPGFWATSKQTTNAPVVLVLHNVNASRNVEGLQVDDNSTIRLAHSTIAGNTFAGAYVNLGGVLYTLGDNGFANNAKDVGGGSLTAWVPK